MSRVYEEAELCDACWGTGRDEHGLDPLDRCEECCGHGVRRWVVREDEEEDDE